jgi:hypothetical protein
MKRIPNLFIIGAMKAGTTSLHDCLSRHPDIFMSGLKEPQYFAPHAKRFHGVWGQGHELPEPGIDWYLRLFEEAGDARYLGESSTGYTKDPWVSGCARRIYAFNPDARLIYILRDPVERTISHYWYNVVGLTETLPMMEAIRSNEHYMAFSHYSRQLQPYLDTFGAGSIYVLTMESLIEAPAETLRALLLWMGLEPDVDAMSFDRLNAGSRIIHQLRPEFKFFSTLRFHWRWCQFSQKYPVAAQTMTRAMCRRIDRKRFDDEVVKTYLRPIQRAQTRELVDLVGREFPEWTTLYPEQAVDRHPVG